MCARSLSFCFDQPFAGPCRKLDNFAMARRLHDHWTSRADSLAQAPGDEYDLVEEFAEMLGIRGWYGWIPDVGCGGGGGAEKNGFALSIPQRPSP